MQNVSVAALRGVLLEKVIRKKCEMYRHETCMRKPFFSKTTCSSTKKEFLQFNQKKKFEKCPEKTQKLSEKLLTGLVSMNIFTDTF